jgi:hypothetical protein
LFQYGSQLRSSYCVVIVQEYSSKRFSKWINVNWACCYWHTVKLNVALSFPNFLIQLVQSYKNKK